MSELVLNVIEGLVLSTSTNAQCKHFGGTQCRPAEGRNNSEDTELAEGQGNSRDPECWRRKTVRELPTVTEISKRSRLLSLFKIAYV